MCPPLVEIGLIDLPKTGGARAWDRPEYLGNIWHATYLFTHYTPFRWRSIVVGGGQLLGATQKIHFRKGHGADMLCCHTIPSQIHHVGCRAGASYQNLGGQAIYMQQCRSFFDPKILGGQMPTLPTCFHWLWVVVIVGHLTNVNPFFPSLIILLLHYGQKAKGQRIESGGVSDCRCCMPLCTPAHPTL